MDMWQALPHGGVARLVALDVARDAALQVVVTQIKFDSKS
jgi:hypothetical protein